VEHLSSSSSIGITNSPGMAKNRFSYYYLPAEKKSKESPSIHVVRL
jgi:hypothetical protein